MAVDEIPCPECGAMLCYLDRLWETCKECEAPLRPKDKLDFSFGPFAGSAKPGGERHGS